MDAGDENRASAAGGITLMKSVQELWEDYLFLTREMVKILDKEDMTIFAELLEQRERLQQSLEGWNKANEVTPQIKQILLKIRKENEQLMLKIQVASNNVRQHYTVDRAYQSLGVSMSGSSFDQRS